MAKKTTVKNLNKETGELEDLDIKFNKNVPKDGSLKFAGTITKDIKAKNIQIYPNQLDEDESPEDPQFGPTMNIITGRHFFQGYNDVEIKFSSSSYFEYWYKVCKALHFGSNIIIFREPSIHPLSEIQDFIKLCGSSKRTTYRFIRECREKGYIAEFTYKGQNMFIVNPKYAYSGKYMPIVLLQLFEFGEKIIEENE